MNENTSKTGIASVWTVLLSLLLAFTLREVLVGITVLPVYSANALWILLDFLTIEDYVIIMQFVVLISLIIRFFSGAFRFHEEASSLDNKKEFKDRAFGSVFNLMMTFVMFSLFFIGAGQASSHDLFYIILFLIHLIDIIWFSTAIIYFRFIMKLDWKEPLLYPVRPFLFISLATIAILSIFAWYPNGEDFFQNLVFGYYLKMFVLVSILILGIIDFTWMRDFYIHPKKWRASLGVENK